MADITEWEFTGDVASWMNVVIDRDSELPFSAAKIEQRGSGSTKRRDISLLDRSRIPVVTGEVKLPWMADGGSPYNAKVVQDAYKKALKAGAKYFFTWNVNECVLWETAKATGTWKDQNYRTWQVANVHSAAQLTHPAAIDEIQSWLAVFLRDIAEILRGQSPVGTRTPDERFIETLESSLKLPILLTLEELTDRYKQTAFKTDLDHWMRTEQGWTIFDDPGGIRDNLENAAKFACYSLVNKLVFYEALLKRYPKLKKLMVPAHIDTGDELRRHLEGFFADAKKVTDDYETVFGEDHKGIGNRIPFYSNEAVPHWRALIDQIHVVDFSKIDYEVVGSIFERLISPEERHKYGQYYTRVEVVDLINSFAFRDGDATVMDPACGGGTFLVRAYGRKRELKPSRKHGPLLSDLFGVDVSNFATHLTTINLATRDLIDDENYPQIARSDFFDVSPTKRFIRLPHHLKARGLGSVQHRNVTIPRLDAVVGNPPYIRQEDIPRSPDKKHPKRGTMEYYAKVASDAGASQLSGRSDIHVYFWPHAAEFLKDGGMLCFITSSQWLDAEYGFRLQRWILSQFEIVAVIESLREPWFVGARVATTVTILGRQSDPVKRNANIVRFVQIRKPMKEVLTHDGTMAGAIAAADTFRDELLALKNNRATDNYRARLVLQADLLAEGIRLGARLKGDAADDDEGDDADEQIDTVEEGEYFGGKWGVHVRAPDLWFALTDRFADRLVPLSEIVRIRRGVTSGKDSFFFPRDISQECLDEFDDPHEFEENYGVERSVVKSGKVKLVACGEGRGEIRPIEAKYLEPEVHNLMEIDGFVVPPENCGRMILLAPSPKSALNGTYAKEYITWGESQGYHKGSTTAARATKQREWYDLRGHDRGKLFWPMAQQYKHAIPVNDFNLICNHNLFDIHLPDNLDAEVIAGVLNSSLVVLSKFQYGRPAGVEGNLKTEVVDVNMMVVPDPSKATPDARKRVKRAFREMKKRKALSFVSEKRMRAMVLSAKGQDALLDELSDESELTQTDRRELDDAVFELLGVTSASERKRLVGELHVYLAEMFEAIRDKEELGIANKNAARRRAVVRPTDIAAQIYDDMKRRHGHLLRSYDGFFLDKEEPFDTLELPHMGEPSAHHSFFTENGVEFTNGRKDSVVVELKLEEQIPLVLLVAKAGLRGLVRVPRDAETCKEVHRRYASHLEERNKRLRELTEERTADADMQQKVLALLNDMVLRQG